MLPRPCLPDKAIRDKVLPVSVALNAEGQPAAPLLKKLAALAAAIGCGDIAVSALERAPDGKADSFFYTYTANGSALQHGLQLAAGGIGLGIGGDRHDLITHGGIACESCLGGR